MRGGSSGGGGPPRTSFEEEDEEFDSDFDEEMMMADSNSEEEEDEDEADGLNLPLELFNLKRQQQRLVQDDLQLDVVQHTRTAARVRYICTGGCWVKAKEEVFIENIRQMSSLLLGEHSIHTFLHIILLQFIRFFISSWCNLSFSSYLTGAK